jgi:hypothetical protein
MFDFLPLLHNFFPFSATEVEKDENEPKSEGFNLKECGLMLKQMFMAFFDPAGVPENPVTDFGHSAWEGLIYWYGLIHVCNSFSSPLLIAFCFLSEFQGKSRPCSCTMPL